MADILVSDGYLSAGYEYINIDDCWMAPERDKQGRLQADPVRFPRGIKALADYVHSRNLKLGIYADYGQYTCAGYPGSLGHMKADAELFAEWQVDYLKLDGCYSNPASMDSGYSLFGYYLNQTGRPIAYSCSWPVYQIYSGQPPNYTSIIEHCNLWRNFDDIQDSWTSVLSIVDYYGDNQQQLIPLAGPGHFNDPDMLIVGNFGLSYEQARSQMALWCILAAPLLVSVDLRNIRPEFSDLLLNRHAIAINQDAMGYQGKRIFRQKGIEIWARPVLPALQGNFSYAIAFFNRRTDGTPSLVSIRVRQLGLAHGGRDPRGAYRVTDVFARRFVGYFALNRTVTVEVNPTGVVLYLFSVV